jgi:hypothetical protein
MKGLFRREVLRLSSNSFRLSRILLKCNRGLKKLSLPRRSRLISGIMKLSY